MRVGAGMATTHLYTTYWATSTFYICLFRMVLKTLWRSLEVLLLAQIAWRLFATPGPPFSHIDSVLDCCFGELNLGQLRVWLPLLQNRIMLPPDLYTELPGVGLRCVPVDTWHLSCLQVFNSALLTVFTAASVLWSQFEQSDSYIILQKVSVTAINVF